MHICHRVWKSNYTVRMNQSVQNKRFREEPEYLVKRLRESDENAFAFLLDTYGKSLYFYCNSILKNDTFAEDIVQESFVRLWERRKNFVQLLPIRVFLIEEEMLGQLYRAIEELPTECARVFKLGLEGLSNQEIADTLSVSIHTVKTQKQRAMSVLKQRFGIGTILVMFGMTDFFI